MNSSEFELKYVPYNTLNSSLDFYLLFEIFQPTTKVL